MQQCDRPEIDNLWMQHLCDGKQTVNKGMLMCAVKIPP